MKIHLVVLSEDEHLIQSIQQVTDMEVHQEISDKSWKISHIVLIDLQTVKITDKIIKILESRDIHHAIALANDFDDLAPNHKSLFTDIWLKQQMLPVLDMRLQTVTKFVRQRQIIDVYVGEINHELLVPFSTMRGYSEVLIDSEKYELGNLTEKQREFLQVILDTILVSVEQTKDLRAWVRAESGNLTLHLERIDLFPIIHELKTEFDFEVAIPEGITVWADEVYLSYLLRRMIQAGNPYKSEDITVKLIVKINEDFVQFTLSSSDIANLRDSNFYVALKGIGWASTELLIHIVNLHNGKIWAEDEHTLHFTLPLAEKNDNT
ncbi:MAG: histidine kinase dimerization/phospho-acceptor domain-containing protein [Chloroflexota bacterium]